MAAGFVFNVLLVVVVFSELYITAKAHNQRLGFYVREVLWGGINPLPHYTDLRAGSLSEVDYEVRHHCCRQCSARTVLRVVEL